MAETSLPTQKFVDVKSIKDGILYLKNGGLRQLLIVGGINFDLKSEEEQNLILSSFQNFLNTLDFSVQFFIHSRKINIDEYLEMLGKRKTEETNELLRIQIEDYISFIRSFVAENPIISKTFFTVVPYDPVFMSNKTGGIFSLFQKKTDGTKQLEAQKQIEQLSHRVNQVISGFQQIGLRATALNDEELIELFYNMYNPQLIEKKGLEIAKQK
ncbi:MAG: hypothetical protein AAB617_02225 [Patescibacteria group bacterium]